MRNTGRGDNASKNELRCRKKKEGKKKKKNRKDRTGSVRDGTDRWNTVDADERIADRRGRRDRGCRAEGHTASLAAVVFRGMLGGRFPRGLCYRLGRMTSPRYQILNLLAPAAYPRQDIQTFPARSSPARPTDPCSNRPTYLPTYTASPYTPATIKTYAWPTTSLSLRLPPALTLFVHITSGYSWPGRRGAQFATARGHFVLEIARQKLFSDDIKEISSARRRKSRELARLIDTLPKYVTNSGVKKSE